MDDLSEFSVQFSRNKYHKFARYTILHSSETVELIKADYIRNYNGKDLILARLDEPNTAQRNLI